MQRLSRTVIQLNIATRGHHVAADTPWLDLMVPAISRHRYLEHLVKVYGFEAPLEAAFRYTPGLGSLIDLRARTRSGLLAQDLMRLGLTPARLAHLPQRFSTFGNIFDALGWMYVVERSTLLHGGVRRYLGMRIPEAKRASCYLSAYDGIADLRWTELGSVLDALARSPAITRQIEHAANDAFRGLCEWFRNEPPGRAASGPSKRKTPPAPGAPATFLAEPGSEWSEPDRDTEPSRLALPDAARIRT